MRHYLCDVCDHGFAVEPIYASGHVAFCPYCGASDPRIHEPHGAVHAARGAAVRRGDEEALRYRSRVPRNLPR